MTYKTLIDGSAATRLAMVSSPRTHPPSMTPPTYEKLGAPASGTRVTTSSRRPLEYIPDDPIVVLIRGDGISRDVGAAAGITTCAVPRP